MKARLICPHNSQHTEWLTDKCTRLLNPPFCDPDEEDLTNDERAKLARLKTDAADSPTQNFDYIPAEPAVLLDVDSTEDPNGDNEDPNEGDDGTVEEMIEIYRDETENASRETNSLSLSSAATINAAKPFHAKPYIPKRCSIDNSLENPFYNNYGYSGWTRNFVLPTCSHVTWQCWDQGCNDLKRFRPQTRLNSPTHATVDLPGDIKADSDTHRHEKQVRVHGPRSFVEGVYRRVAAPQVPHVWPNSNLSKRIYIISKVVGFISGGRRGRKFYPTNEDNDAPDWGAMNATYEGEKDFEFDYLLEVKLMYARGQMTFPVYWNEGSNPDFQNYPRMGQQQFLRGSYNYEKHPKCDHYFPNHPDCPYRHSGRTYIVVSQENMPRLISGEHYAHEVKLENGWHPDKWYGRTVPVEGMSAVMLGQTIATEGVALEPKVYGPISAEVIAKWERYVRYRESYKNIIVTEDAAGNTVNTVASDLTGGTTTTTTTSQTVENGGTTDNDNVDPVTVTTASSTNAYYSNLVGWVLQGQIQSEALSKRVVPNCDCNDSQTGAPKCPGCDPDKYPPRSDLRAFVTLPRRNCPVNSAGNNNLGRSIYPRPTDFINENLGASMYGSLVFNNFCAGQESKFALSIYKHGATLV
jgi:hypothetical protein